MKLATWLSTNGVTQQAFAEMVGSSQPQVARFAAGTRMPNVETMRRIIEATDREVTADDFYAEPERAA